MTTPAPPDQPHAVAAAAAPPFSSLVRIDVSALSHPGHRRENNEDHFFVTRLGRTLQTLITSLPAGDVPERTEEVNYVMVVADGMGGHAAGEVASRMAIAALISLALDVPDWIFRVDEEHAREMERRSRKRVQEVGAMLVERGQRDPALRGMGTTLTAARSLGRDLLITHVGDSRAYLLRGGSPASPDAGPHLCAAARRHRPARARRRRRLAPSSRADQRAWRSQRGCPRRHRPAAARGRRSPAALQRWPDRSGGRRDDHPHPAGGGRVERRVRTAGAAGARQRRAGQRHRDRGRLRHSARTGANESQRSGQADSRTADGSAT